MTTEDGAGDIFRFGKGVEVLQDDQVEKDDADGQAEHVEDKVSMVVDADAVVDPGAVVIVLRSAAFAHLTVLAAQGSARHAGHAEIMLVEFVLLEEFVNLRLLGTAAASLGDVAGIFDHGSDVEVSAKSIANGEDEI